jgi:F0F1-type ATP synthase membrane subunit b/b'
MASPENNRSDPVSGAGTTQTHRATQSDTAAAQGEHLTERARQKAGELAGGLKRQAEESAEDLRQRALSAVDQQKEAAIGGIEGVAHALRSASDDLRERGQPLAAEYSRQVADGVESLANWVSRRNVDDVKGGLEDFARARPVAFLGGAVVAGFAIARFMKSSSARRLRTSGYEYGGATAGSSRPPRRAAPDSAGRSMPSSSKASGGTPYERPTEGGV